MPNADSQTAVKIIKKLTIIARVILTNTQKIMTLKTDDCIATIIAKLNLLTIELEFQNSEKEKRAAELIIANQELAFQNSEKEKRAAELVIANQELVFQNTEKEKRAAELIIANEELAFQSSEKEKRAAELVIANEKIIIVNQEFVRANEQLIFQSSERERQAVELAVIKITSSEREKHATELLKANDYLSYANEKIAMNLQELSVLNDYKERQNLEITLAYKQNEILNQHLNHMQKLESIGRLTSGIAHDFNNILACVMGYNEMNQYIADDITETTLKTELEYNTRQIDSASRRAAELINKMLTYCRQDTAKKQMNVQPTHQVIKEVLDMLRPALTSRIKIEFKNQCNINNNNNNDCETCGVFKSRKECFGNIEIDAIDLHQILTNLAVNARDAMKERGGVITISLNTVTYRDVHCVACAKVLTGEFIELSLSDNGTGIDSVIISRIFDPFFTTKEQGEGTGLGLSTLSGMVHSSNGHILVDSVLGEGTTFRLLFPTVN